jgi:hypothetical protein
MDFGIVQFFYNLMQAHGRCGFRPVVGAFSTELSTTSVGKRLFFTLKGGCPEYFLEILQNHHKLPKSKHFLNVADNCPLMGIIRPSFFYRIAPRD